MPLIRSANFNLLIEISIRIALITCFCYMEGMTPFIRVIPLSELENNCKYPHKESYVPSSMLWMIVIAVPCILSLLAWGVCNDCNDAFEILLAWSLALGLNGVLTDMVKLIVGRPRPDFFYRCFPDGIGNPELQCTGDPVVVMDGRKSFPSGHSSMSWCSLGTGAVWVCGRLRVLGRGRGAGARVVSAVSPLVVALAVALSRTCDYHHHWQDVLVGSILGFSIAIFCYRQYYNPLSSDLSGVPYIVSNSIKHPRADSSPVSECSEIESSPLISSVKKEDKWI